MNGRIAVGITDGPASQRAVDWSIRQAAESHDRLVLLSVVGEGSGVRGEQALLDRALAGAEVLLSDAKKRAADSGVAADALVERGTPLARLLELSQRVRLLVIGSDRVSGSSAHRGALSLRVSAGAHCPVVVVPDRDLAGGAGIVVGVDGSEISERAIRFAAQEAELHGEALTAVMAWSPVPVPMQIGGLPREYLVNAQKLAEEDLAISVAGLRQDYPDLMVLTVVEPEHPARLIRRTASAARMVVVGSHGRGALGRFLLGSTSQLLLEQPPCVVAIVR